MGLCLLGHAGVKVLFCVHVGEKKCLCVYELLSATASKQLFSLWHFYGLSSAKIILVKALALSLFGREDVCLSLVSVCKCPYSLMG